MADRPNLEPLEADAPQDDRSDTASLSGGSINSSLDSVRSSIRKHRRENGRRYATLGDEKYILPNDEMEQERLDMAHDLWQLTWEGELCMCPKRDTAKRVLDLGTGTGVWAMDYADEHPEATVIGVDLTPIQPSYVPPNCSFEIDDVEKDWTWSTPFDFIFVRHMNSCFASWEKMLEQAYMSLEPGGYIELQDNTFPLDCQDDTMPETTAVARWSSMLMEGTEKIGRRIDTPANFKKLLEDAGFEAVVEEKRVWPLSPWPKDPHLRDLGTLALPVGLDGCEASALVLFTNVLGWSRAETLVFCSEVRRDIKNTNIHAFWNVYSVYGRKPLREPTPAALVAAQSPPDV